MIADLMDDNAFVHNPRVRKTETGRIPGRDPGRKIRSRLRAEIIQKWRTQLRADPFSSAALRTPKTCRISAVPDFIRASQTSATEDKLIEAVKNVWASLWKFAGV